MADLDKDGYEVIPPRPENVRKGIKCGECGMRFDDGVSYSYYCPNERCPIFSRVS